MGKHTPGPWSVPHFACDDTTCECGSVLSDSQRGMGAIATVHVSKEGADWREGDHEPPEIAKANAYLIAAAPDLLAVAKAAMAFIDSHAADHDITEKMRKAYAALMELNPQAIIDKATGDSQ